MDDSNIDEQMEAQNSLVGGTVMCVGCNTPAHINNAFWKTRSMVRDFRLPPGMQKLSKSKNMGTFGKKYLKEHFCDRCSMLITGYIENLGTSNG